MAQPSGASDARSPLPAAGTARRLVVIGGSAGALPSLLRIVEQLESVPDAALAVCLHRAATGISVMTPLLTRRSRYQATEPSDGDPLHPGFIFIARAGHHLEIEPGRLRVTRGPLVNGHRPSIDVLFNSAAHSYGASALGVCLSGTLDDGAGGLHRMEREGAVVVVQDPTEAEFPNLPRAAIQRCDAPAVASSAELPAVVNKALLGIGEGARVASAGRREAVPACPEMLGAGDEAGSPTGVVCPECSGTLWLTGDTKDPRLTCGVDHSMAPGSLQELQSERLDRALWTALRSLEEQTAVASFMALMARRRGDVADAERHQARAERAAQQVAAMRDLLLEPKGGGPAAGA